MVPERVRAVLLQVGPALSAEGFYLAGGTALALRLGHRESVDLDWFKSTPFDAEAVYGIIGKGKLLLAKQGTLHVDVDGVLVSCLHYPYPLLETLQDWQGISVAGIMDIALMKLTAVANRGAKKDFVDLFVIAQQGGMKLDSLLQRVQEKYGARVSMVHLLKSLTYFADAEMDPMPKVAKGLEWETIKAWFLREVPRVVSDDLRLTSGEPPGGPGASGGQGLEDR